jgi:hypothetical protein
VYGHQALADAGFGHAEGRHASSGGFARALTRGMLRDADLQDALADACFDA